MKKKPINQHDVPATYLRRFSSRKNHVWCLFNHEFEGWKIEEKSVNADYFKHKHIYTLHNTPEPYALENLLADELENKYFSTVNKIISEQQIEPTEIGFLSLWMYISKFRNLTVKNDWTTFTKQILLNKLAIQKKLNYETEKEIEEYAKNSMSKFFPKVLENKEMLLNFCDLMAGKSWEVLVANENINFITNDNPGYSFFLEKGYVDTRTFNYNFTVNVKSVNIFPLSPKHSLHIMPIAYNNEDNVDSIPKLYYRKANEKTVQNINTKTIGFKKRYLIASTKNELEQIKSSM